MVVAFDWGAGYGLVLAVAAATATLGAAGAVVAGVVRYTKRRLKPEPPREPDVVLGHAGAQKSLTPLHTLADGEHARLISVKPHYLIENKETARSIRNVTTGARTRDGSKEHVFAEFQAPLIGARETVQFMAKESIPLDWLEGVHESVAQDAFLYWIRFADADGRSWEIVYDPESRRCSAYTI